MARRHGGRFSPDDPTRPDLPQVPRHPQEGRPKWVTLAAAPFLLGAFFQPAAGMVADLAAFGLIASGMWMTREGLEAQAQFDIRPAARRPAIPRKLFGGIMAGLGLGVGAADPGAVLGTGLIGLAGLALHQLSFGLDPWRDKGVAGVDDFQQGRAERMIDEAEARLREMEDAIRRANDRHVEARVEGFARSVRHMLDRVRSNPAALASARRYMGVYLTGARDATARFAALHAQTRDAGARARFEDFLDELEKDFIAVADRLLDGDRAALEIEMSVLRDRLDREGLRAPEAAPRSTEARDLDALLSPGRDRTGRD